MAAGTYFRLSDLHVGDTDCPVLVRVDTRDEPQYVEKMEAYEASWVLMDPDGYKVDLELINREEAFVNSWFERLPLQGVVVLKNFRVVEQKNLR